MLRRHPLIYPIFGFEPQPSTWEMTGIKALISARAEKPPPRTP
jgi:hypothetical protein